MEQQELAEIKKSMLAPDTHIVLHVLEEVETGDATPKI